MSILKNHLPRSLSEVYRYIDLLVSGDGFEGIIPVANGGSGAATAREAARLNSGIYVLAQSAVAVPHTGTTSETILAAVTVPAGAMGPNGRIRATAHYSYTNNANNKNLRMRFGGIAGHLIHVTTGTTTTNARIQVEGANRNATGSQSWLPTSMGGGFGTNSGSLVVSSIDTTVAQDFCFLATLGNAADTITLESYLVELIAGSGA
jgi:hypothetical protein